MSDSASPQLNELLKKFLDTCNSIRIAVEGQTVQPLKAGQMFDEDQNPALCWFTVSRESLDVLATISRVFEHTVCMGTKTNGEMLFVALNQIALPHAAATGASGTSSRPNSEKSLESGVAPNPQ